MASLSFRGIIGTLPLKTASGDIAAVGNFGGTTVAAKVIQQSIVSRVANELYGAP